MDVSAPWHMSRVAPSVLMGFCCLVGVPGNVTVVAVLTRRRLQRSSFTLTLMLSLAVADLLSLLLLPAVVHNLLRGWPLGSATCQLFFFLLYWSINASVLSVTLLSVQRYLQVLHSLRWARLGPGGQWALLGAVWALGCCIASPHLAVRVVRGGGGGSPQHCDVEYGSDLEEAAVLLLQTLLGFVVPFSVLVSLYVCLHRRVNQTALFSSSRRMTRLVTSIVVTFFVFWVPIHVFNVLMLLALATGWEELKDVCGRSWDMLTAFTLINACINPLLYTFAHSQLHTHTPR